MNPLPERLRAARLLAGYKNTEDLAAALGHQPGLSGFQLGASERGDRIPKPAYVNEIGSNATWTPAGSTGNPGTTVQAE